MAITYSDPDVDADEHTIQIAALPPADNAVIIGNGTAWTAESGATLRASLGLAIGSDVMAYDADLNDWAGVSPSNYLTTAAAAAAYQPLDSDLTAWAAVNPSSYSTTAQIAAAYQPLDGDLTSWAGVTRAAGFDAFAATPSSANLRTLLSDESGSGALLFAGGALDTPASGTLTNCTGLPSSGVITGTSGAAIPLLNGANAWGALQTHNAAVEIAYAATGITQTDAPLRIISTDAGTNGPTVALYHNSASPAVSDLIRPFRAYFNDSALAPQLMAGMNVTTENVTAGAWATNISFFTAYAGAVTTRFRIGQGLYADGVTGGDKGASSGNFGSLFVANDPVMTRGATETVPGPKTFSSTVNLTADPASSFQIDFTNAATFTIANAANAAIGTTAFSGVIILHDSTDGHIGLYLVGAGVTYKIGGAAKYVSSSAPASGEVGVQYDGVDRYRIYNNQGSSRTLYVSLMRTRPAV